MAHDAAPTATQAALQAALPPLDPFDARARSYGVRVWPCVVAAHGPHPKGEVLVVARVTNPAARSRSPQGLSALARIPACSSAHPKPHRYSSLLGRKIIEHDWNAGELVPPSGERVSQATSAASPSETSPRSTGCSACRS